MSVRRHQYRNPNSEFHPYHNQSKGIRRQKKAIMYKAELGEFHNSENFPQKKVDFGPFDPCTG